MILADSSALIEYYRPSGDPLVRATVAEAVAADSVAINGIIQVELMAFAASQADYDDLAGRLQGVPLAGARPRPVRPRR